ncbi:MAG: hypothetical protein Q4C82_02255 [Eubacteriales bacterium]|nr:hypothetical protein [Eubacteriales bacterium]
MKYYYFAMIPFYCLTLLNLAAVIGAGRQKGSGVKFAVTEICVFLALASQYYFLGVLADNGADIRTWSMQMLLLTGLNVLALAAGVVRLKKRR